MMWSDNQYKSERVNDTITCLERLDYRSRFCPQGFEHRATVAAERAAEVMLWMQQTVGPCLTTYQYKASRHFMPVRDVQYLVDGLHIYLKKEALTALRLAWSD